MSSGQRCASPSSVITASAPSASASAKPRHRLAPLPRFLGLKPGNPQALGLGCGSIARAVVHDDDVTNEAERAFRDVADGGGFVVGGDDRDGLHVMAPSMAITWPEM